MRRHEAVVLALDYDGTTALNDVLDAAVRSVIAAAPARAILVLPQALRRERSDHRDE